MSAYICNDYHISAIVQAGIHFQAWTNLGEGWDYIKEEHAQHVFEVLKRENIRSVNRRYNETTPADTERLGAHRFVDVSPLAVLKAIACLEYQSCEHEQWEGSLAKAVLQSIKEAAIRRLPGYDAADWELKEPAGYVAPISLMSLVKKARKK